MRSSVAVGSGEALRGVFGVEGVAATVGTISGGEGGFSWGGGASVGVGVGFGATGTGGDFVGVEVWAIDGRSEVAEWSVEADGCDEDVVAPAGGARGEAEGLGVGVALVSEDEADWDVAEGTVAEPEGGGAPAGEGVDGPEDEERGTSTRWLNAVRAGGAALSSGCGKRWAEAEPG